MRKSFREIFPDPHVLGIGHVNPITTFITFAALVITVLTVVLFTGRDVVSCPSTPRGVLMDSRHHYVEKKLPSIEKFRLFDLSESPHNFDFASSAADIVAELNAGNLKIPFRQLVNYEVHLTSQFPGHDTSLFLNGKDTIIDTKGYSFRGIVTELDPFGNPYERSLVALHIQSDGDRDGDGRDEVGFVSGFVILDIDDQGPNDWFFIEPVRPLLRPLVDGNAKAQQVLENCIPARKHTHIVYNAADTDFAIVLDPITTAKATITGFNTPCAVVIEESITIEVTITNQTTQTESGEIAFTKQGLPFDGRNFRLSSVNNSKKPKDDDTPQTRRGTQETFTTTTQADQFGYLEIGAETSESSVTHIVMVTDGIPKVQSAPAEAAMHFDCNCDGFLSQEELDKAQNTKNLSHKDRAYLEYLQSSGQLFFPVPDPPFQEISFVTVGDEDYYLLYENIIGEKTWWEGQEEVLNLVAVFYSTKFPDLKFKPISYEAWTYQNNGPLELNQLTAPQFLGDNGDPTSSLNAYTLLCHFAQEIYPEAPLTSATTVSSGVPKIRNTPLPHQHAIRDQITLVQLFSGHDLGPFPTESALADEGDGWCSSSCSSVDSKIVGLAEGTGGFQNQISQSCILDNLKDPVGFEPEAHHGVSRVSPIIGTPDRNPNRNYQANLYERFLLVTHEVGHNLGGPHSVLAIKDAAGDVFFPDYDTVMYTPLTKLVKFKIAGQSRSQIILCWNGCK